MSTCDSSWCAVGSSLADRVYMQMSRLSLDLFKWNKLKDAKSGWFGISETRCLYQHLCLNQHQSFVINVEDHILHYCIHIYQQTLQLMRRVSSNGSLLKMQCNYQCLLFFSIISFIFSTKLKHNACYTLMDLAYQVI